MEQGFRALSQIKIVQELDTRPGGLDEVGTIIRFNFPLTGRTLLSNLFATA